MDAGMGSFADAASGRDMPTPPAYVPPPEERRAPEPKIDSAATLVPPNPGQPAAAPTPPGGLMGSSLGKLFDVPIPTTPVPKPYEPPKATTPMERFGSTAMSFAVLGSLMTRQPLTNALTAGAAVNNAYAEGDHQAAEAALINWKAQVDHATLVHKFQEDAYNNAMKKGENYVKALAVAFQDAPSLQALETGGVRGMAQLQAERERIANGFKAATIGVQQQAVNIQQQQVRQSDEHFNKTLEFNKLKLNEEIAVRVSNGDRLRERDIINLLGGQGDEGRAAINAKLVENPHATVAELVQVASGAVGKGTAKLTDKGDVEKGKYLLQARAATDDAGRAAIDAYTAAEPNWTIKNLANVVAGQAGAQKGIGEQARFDYLAKARAATDDAGRKALGELTTANPNWTIPELTAAMSTQAGKPPAAAVTGEHDVELRSAAVFLEKYGRKPDPADAADNAVMAHLRGEDRKNFRGTGTNDFASPVLATVDDGAGNKSLVLAQQNKTTGQWVTADESRSPVTGVTNTAKPGDAPGENDPTVKKTAEMVAKYQLAPLSGFVMKTPFGQAVMAEVGRLNPEYSAPRYGEISKAVKDFGTGMQGRAINSFNVAIAHLDTLDELGQALKNGNMQAVNRLANEVKAQTGSPGPTNFDAAKQIIGQEIVKAIIASGGGVTERQAAEDKIKSSFSWTQLKGVSDTYRSLMAGQLRGLKKQYEDTTSLRDFDDRLLPRTRAALGMGGEGPAAAAAGGRPPSAEAVAELKRRPDLRSDFDAWYGVGAAAKVLGQ